MRLSQPGFFAAFVLTASSVGLGAPPAPPVRIATTSLPVGTVGQQYSAALSATGGVTPYTWTISSGNLPSGLTLSSRRNDQRVAGICRNANFTVKVTGADGKNDNDTQALSIVVSARPGHHHQFLAGWTGRRRVLTNSTGQRGCRAVYMVDIRGLAAAGVEPIWRSD